MAKHKCRVSLGLTFLTDLVDAQQFKLARFDSMNFRNINRINVNENSASDDLCND